MCERRAECRLLSFPHLVGAHLFTTVVHDEMTVRDEWARHAFSSAYFDRAVEEKRRRVEHRRVLYYTAFKTGSRILHGGGRALPRF